MKINSLNSRKSILVWCIIATMFFLNPRLNARNTYIDATVKDFPSFKGKSPKTFDLISHGRPGQLFLEGKWRNANQIVTFIKNKHLLTCQIENLNIYGCEFGKNTEGLMAVAIIKKALGINIAASNNITGKNGDWILEVGKTSGSLNEPNYPFDLQTICRDTTFTTVTSGWSGPTSMPPYNPPVGCINNNGSTINGNITDFYGAGFYTSYDSPDGYLWSRTLSGLNPASTYRVRLSLRSSDNNTNGRDGFFQNYSLAGLTGTFTAHSNTSLFDQQDFVLLRSNVSSLSFSGTIVGDPWDSCDQVVNYYVTIFVDEATNIAITYAPPTPSSSNITNICPSNTSNLSGVATGCGSGSVLEWHNTNVGYSAASKLANITSVADGTYYAICHNTTRACYSTPSTAVTVSNTQCPLPLELKNITAAWSGNDAVLIWTVAGESNMDHYTIERSLDGKIFTETGQVKSIGDHIPDHNYIFRDVDVRRTSENEVLYRLKQVARDGHYKTSTIVRLDNNARPEDAYVYPNPLTGDDIKFIYQSNVNRSIALDLYINDVYGRKVYQKKVNISKGKNQISLPLEDIATGVYLLKFANKQNGIDGVIRIVKK